MDLWTNSSGPMGLRSLNNLRSYGTVAFKQPPVLWNSGLQTISGSMELWSLNNLWSYGPQAFKQSLVLWDSGQIL